MLISPVHRSDDYPPVMGRYLHSSPHVHGGKLPYAVHCLGRHPAHGKQWRDKENGIQEIWGSIDQSSMSKEEILVVCVYFSLSTWTLLPDSYPSGLNPGIPEYILVDMERGDQSTMIPLRDN